MPVQYAKDQPAGFTNHIERVAIIGVRISLLVNATNTTLY